MTTLDAPGSSGEAPVMFKIIGADRKEYGPVTEAQVREWIAEGRANGQTLARKEGEADWKPLASVPEFSSSFAPSPPAPPPVGTGPTPSPLPVDVLQRETRLNIADCLNRGWTLFSTQFGTVFAGCAVFIAVEFAISGLGAIPVIGPLISVAGMLIYGPLMGGLYFYLLKLIRGQPTEVGEVFAGFRLCFLQLMVAYVVTTLLCGLAATPGGVLIVIGVVSMIARSEPGVIQVAMIALGLLIALLPMIYLAICWLFSLPLIIDKGMDFWPAMETSRKVVNRRWWKVFLFMVICGLINLVGFLMCCVGTFFTLPITFAAMMYAYEDLFGVAQRPAA